MTNGLRNAAAWSFCLLIGTYFYLGAQPMAVGLLGSYDKLGHSAFYAAITVMLWLASRGRRPWLLLCAVALIGCTDEIYQSFLPGRDSDVGDIVADVIASAVALVFLQHAAATNLFKKYFFN